MVLLRLTLLSLSGKGGPGAVCISPQAEPLSLMTEMNLSLWTWAKRLFFFFPSPLVSFITVIFSYLWNISRTTVMCCRCAPHFFFSYVLPPICLIRASPCLADAFLPQMTGWTKTIAAAPRESLHIEERGESALETPPTSLHVNRRQFLWDDSACVPMSQWKVQPVVLVQTSGGFLRLSRCQQGHSLGCGTPVTGCAGQRGNSP